MKTHASSLALLLLGLAAAAPVWAAPADSYTWNGATSTYWSTSADWIPATAPISSVENSLTFVSSATSFTTSNNIANGFLVNQINFQGTGSGTMTVGGLSTNDSVTFQTDGEGDLPTINDSASGAATLGMALITTNALAVSNTGAGLLTLSGAVTNNGGIVFNGGSINLGGTQWTTGTTGTITLNSGTIYVGGNHQLSGSATTGSGGALLLDGGEFASTSAVGGTEFTVANATTVDGIVQVGDSSHASVAFGDSITLDDGSSLTAGSALTLSTTLTLATGSNGVTFGALSGQTLTISGQITGGNSVIYGGAGTILLTGAPTSSNYTGTTTVNAGTTVELDESSSAHVGIPGNLIINGGTVTQVSAGQIAATSAVMVENGGTFGMSNLTANTTEETIASLTLGASSSDTAHLTFVLPASGNGTTSPFLKITGSLTVNTSNPIILNLSGGISGDSYSLLTWTGTVPLADFEVNPADVGYTLSDANGLELWVSYSAVPEPSVTGLIGVGLGLFAFLGWRRARLAAQAA